MGESFKMDIPVKNRHRLLGLVQLCLFLAIYVSSVSYLSDPGSQYPEWMKYLIALPIVFVVLGAAKAITNKSTLDFFKAQKHYSGKVQSIVNVIIFLMMIFILMNFVHITFSHQLPW